MSDRPDAPALSELMAGQFVHAVSGIFHCLGRALICLDKDFTIVHASDSLDALVEEGAAQRVAGLPVQQVFGTELFGAGASLRAALESGQRREGWGATFQLDGSPTAMMSLTAAPVRVDSPLCDPRVAYLLVVRGSDDATESNTALPTLFAGMLGRSSAMLGIFRLVQNLSESEATVLITGDSGTGKELIARALHHHSPRRTGRFVAVNCGALPGDLLESELFGHVRGAFSGAVRDREGRFERAQGGTLFLDEVADLSPPLQVKLLRVLQERTYERVGESLSRSTDARIIAATNRNLPRAVAEGSFREDLYYRLRVVPLRVPPLAERREDIEPLARHLLARVAARNGRSLLLGPDALRSTLAYPWPGNVRELENALEYAIAVCRGQTIHADDLPQEVQEGVPPQALGSMAAAPDSATAIPAERDRLREALEAHRWNRADTARALGMSRTTLWRKMREVGLAD